MNDKSKPGAVTSSSHSTLFEMYANNASSGQPPGKDDTQPILYRDRKTAHSTITEELIERCRKSGGCSRCRRTGCFCKTCDGMKEMVVSAGNRLKRKQEDKGEGSSVSGLLEKRIALVPKKPVVTVSSASLRTVGGVRIQKEGLSSSNIY